MSTTPLSTSINKYQLVSISILVSSIIVFSIPFFASAAVNWATNIIPIITLGASTWTVPGDWDNNSNSIEVIGGGGGGRDAGNGAGTGGAGGGAYASTTGVSLTPGASINIYVGSGGTAGTSGNDTSGGDTYFNRGPTATTTCDMSERQTVCAKGGSKMTAAESTTAVVAGASGGEVGSIGTTIYAGGNGGTGNGNGDSGGGGGGAGGFRGPGRTGGNGSTVVGGGGGGGGGAGGGQSTVGVNAGTTAGGNGGIGPTGIAGGTGATASGQNGNPGSNGSGGGGSDNLTIGGAGGTGQEWATSTPFGSGGGGGGGSNSDAGGAGGLYGGGGGSGETGGGRGGQGIIVIQYNSAFSVSGTLYNDEGVSADTSGADIIKLAVATGTVPGLYATTTRPSGFFEFRFPYSGFTAATGAPMVLWLSGQASKAVSITKASSTDVMSMITNFDLYKNRVIVGHEATSATSTTINDLARYDHDNNSDIPYIANGGTLDVLAGNELHIKAGSEFAPGGAVTIHGNGSSGTFPDGNLHLDTGRELETTVATSSILTMGSNNLTLAGSLFASSTSILKNSGTITFNATTTGKQIFATSSPTSVLGNVTFNGSGGGWTFGDNASTTNFNITNGTVTAPSGLLSISGNYTNGGTFTNNSGTVLFDRTSGSQTLFGVMATSSPLNNVQFFGAGTKTFGASYASTSDFIINSGSGAVTAPSTVLSVSGNYTNSATFTHNSGTVLLNGSSPQTIAGTLSGSTGSFGALTLINSYDGNPDSGPAVIFSAAASTTGTFTAATASTTIRFPASATSTFQNMTLTGGSATSMVWLRSSTAGTPWGLAVPGTRSVTYVNVKDSSADCGFANINASDGTSVNAGGNNCWTFPAPASITVSGKLYSDEGITAIGTAKTIKLSVNGGTAQSATNGGDGSYSFSVTQSSLAVGYPIAVWVSGDAATRAFAMTKASSTSGFITTLDLYQNRVIVKHEQTTATSTTNDDLAFFTQGLDSAIPYSVSAGALTVKAGSELHVAPGSEFAPGGAVTISGNGPSGSGIDGSLHLPVGSATSSILTMSSNNLTLAGSLNASSTSILSNGGTITFNATTTGKIIIATTSPLTTLGAVTFKGSSGGWKFGDNASTTNLTITTGSVTAPSLLTVTGNFSNSGTFTNNSGTVYFTGATKTLNSGGSSFNNIEVSGSYTAQTNSLTVAGNATISGTLDGRDFPLIMSGSSKTLTGGGTLGAFNVTGSATLSGADLTVGTTTINSGGTLTIGSGRVLTSTSSLAVSGTLDDSGGTTTIQHSNLAAPGGTLNSNVRFDASSVTSRNMPARTYGGNVEIYTTTDNPAVVMLSGTHTISKNLMLQKTGATTITLDGSTNSAAATISGDVSFLSTGGTIDTGASANTWQVSGNTNFTNGTFTAGAGNTWTMNGTNKTLTSASQKFKNLTLSGMITTADAVSATGALVLSGSAITLGNTASTTGSATLSGTIYPQQQPVILNGIGATLTGGGTVGALQTNGTYTLSGSDLTVGTSTIITNGAMTVGEGRVYTSTSTLTLVGSITGSGTTTIQHSNLSTGGTLSSNVSFSGSVTMPARTYGANVEIVNGAAVTAGGNATSTNAFLINAGGSFTAPSATQSLYVGGDYRNYGTFTHNSGKVFFNGTGGQIILGATSSNAFNNVDFSGGGTKTFSGNASTTNLTIQGGAGAVTAPTLLSVAGNYSNLGTFAAGNGTTTFSGTSAQTISGVATGTSAFYNLDIINSSASTTFAAAASTTKNFYVTTANAKVEFSAGATSSMTNLIVNGQAANTAINLFSGTPGTQWNIYATGTRSVQFARVQDSDACSDAGDIDASGGNNTNVSNNECWTFVANVAATATSSANQTFEVNQSATAMSQLTVTAGSGTGGINANDSTGDLRIAIATSTVNMLWDTTKTDAIFGGTASSSAKIAACGCVVFEGGGSVAKIDVTTNFSSGDVLTISGLRFTTFSVATASSTALQLFLNGPNDTSANAQDTLRNVAIYGKLALGAHASGQPANQFDKGDANLNNVEVFRFKFTPTGENASNTPTISLSNISGISSSNISNANLYVDADNSASVNSGDYTVGGAGAVSITGTAGTITFSTPFAATTTSKNYILRADFTSVNPGDQMTFGLTTANITASGTVSQLNITPSGSVAAATHFRPSGGGAAPTGGGSPADVGTFGGTGQSGGSPTGGGESGGQQGGGTGPGGGTGGGIDLEPLLLRKLAQAMSGFERLWKYFNR